MHTKPTTAILALADGTVLHGIPFGAVDTVPYICGELVFNTSMTGYQEMISDPSYCGQIIMFTQPHIGNVGINNQDSESNFPEKIWSNGIVIKSLSLVDSNWRSQDNLNNYLIKHNLIGISNVDTRHLTNILRNAGAQNACIYIIKDQVSQSLQEAGQQAVSLAQQTKSLVGVDLAERVSTDKIYNWQAPSYKMGDAAKYTKTILGTAKSTETVLDHAKSTGLAHESLNKKFHVVVYDFGVKQQILKLLIDRDCQVTVVPAKTTVQQVLDLKPDGVLLSNGPGDPAACTYAIQNTKQLINLNIPLFGICLGFQILGLALGGTTTKMKFGHHGANHPVKDYLNNMILITSQNHGFTVEESSLDNNVILTHKSLFDNSLQGFMHKTLQVFGFQGHPESSPGPTDVEYLFDKFISIMKNYKSEKLAMHQDYSESKIHEQAEI